MLKNFIFANKKEKIFSSYELIMARIKNSLGIMLSFREKILLNCIQIQEKFRSVENINSLSLDNVVIKRMLSDDKMASLLSFPSLNLESLDTETSLNNLKKSISNFDERMHQNCNDGLIMYTFTLEEKNKILGHYLQNFL